MDRLKIRQFVVVCVDANAEEKSSIPPVDDLVVPKLLFRQQLLFDSLISFIPQRNLTEISDLVVRLICEPRRVVEPDDRLSR